MLVYKREIISGSPADSVDNKVSRASAQVTGITKSRSLLKVQEQGSPISAIG
jgi:hypothetical protein